MTKQEFRAAYRMARLIWRLEAEVLGFRDKPSSLAQGLPPRVYGMCARAGDVLKWPHYSSIRRNRLRCDFSTPRLPA